MSGLPVPQGLQASQDRHASQGVHATQGLRVALGLGCDRGTPAATLARAVDEALARLPGAEVVAVASISLKADEPGMAELAAARGWRIVFHPPEVLARVPVPNPSEVVRKYTGTPSVSEAAALLAAGASMDALRVEKHKCQGPDGRNATVSVAEVAGESTGGHEVKVKAGERLLCENPWSFEQ